MTDKLSLDPKPSALLVMDFQTAVVEMVASATDDLLARTTNLIEGAREAGMRVIYVVVGFRAGYPEVSPRNASFGPIRESGRFAKGSPGMEGRHRPAAAVACHRGGRRPLHGLGGGEVHRCGSQDPHHLAVDQGEGSVRGSGGGAELSF